MKRVVAATGVPAGALLAPTLMITGSSASAVYAQPAAELARLTKAGATIKLARGFYAAVPVGKDPRSWLPSMEDITAGIATAIYGVGQGALWGLSAARVHGALPRALATGYAFGPSQHRPVPLLARSGHIEFRRRDPHRLDLEYLPTELGPGLVTSIAQTVLDLSARDFDETDPLRQEAVINLMSVVDHDELVDLSTRVRGRSALARAQGLVRSAE